MSKIDKIMSRRLFMQRSALTALAAAPMASLLPSTSYANTPKKGGKFVLGLKGGESTDTLDPAINLGSASSYALYAFGDYLVEFDAAGNLIPSLALSWNSKDGGKTWDFVIRQGVEFHNGKILTAKDVQLTMERHSNESSKSGALGIMRGIESMSTAGDVFSVTLKSANSDLPYLMSDYHLLIQPEGGVDNPSAGIGTGPYRLKVEEPGIRYTFEKFDRHWNDQVGHYDSHDIIVLNDDTARVAALQSGQVHAIDKVPPRIAKLAARAPGVSIVVTPGPGHYIFVMHTDTAPFDNKDLRLALKYAIDRESMVETVLNGFGSIGNDIPINDSYPLFDTTLEQRPFSLELAAEHYKKSGHDGSPIVLQVSDAAFPGAVDAAQLFQQTAKAAGIPLKLDRLPSDGYWSEIWNKKPFCASFWGGRPVQDQMYSTAYFSGADWNDTRYSDAEFDAMLVEARAEVDLERKKAIYAKMARLVHNDGGLINPMFNQFIDGYSDKVAGVIPHYKEMLTGNVAKLSWFA